LGTDSWRGSIAGSELNFLICFTLVLCFVTSLPYVLGRVVSFPGRVFTGVLDHSFDTNNYLAYVHQSATGSWLFHNPMTGEAHAPAFFNLEWLLMGKITRVFHLEPATAMDVGRLLCLMLMCVAAYWLSSFVFESPLMRRIATVACLAGGGFGWIVTVHLFHVRLDSSYFLDLTNANLFPFYWELRVAHFLVAESFIVIGLCFFLYAESRGRVRDYLAAGLCYVAAGTCRPYDMLFVMAATSLFLALSFTRADRPKSALVLRALPIWICVPVLSYYYWLFKVHPVFRWWSIAGNPAPPAWLLALSFGPSFLLLPVATWRLRRERISSQGLFVLCCFVSAVVLAHLHWLFHFTFQFATNILIPMVMLVLLGFERPMIQFRQTRRLASAWIVAILCVNSLTSLALASQAVVLAAHGEYRIDSDRLAAFLWLNEHTRPDDVTFADLENSNSLPQYISSRVYCGYGNAVHADYKLKAMREFFNPQTTNGFREDLLRRSGIQFVLLTASEIGDFPGLVQAPFLREVFRNNGAVILSVQVPAEM
jgi:hypothetical protein